jgi:hypothetical protein
MYRYETHMHTLPVSRCARATVRESLEFYKSIGYDGVFITNHFIDGNVNINEPMTYEENHSASAQKKLAGMSSEKPIFIEEEFVTLAKKNQLKIFELMNNNEK